MSPANIRRAAEADLPALLDIYNHYVANTHITFDLEPRSFAEHSAWFLRFAASGRYQCFVADQDGDVIGWASSSKFRDRAAYDTSVETTVYLAPGMTGRGIGRVLYEALLAALSREDVHRAYGAIAAPNAVSVRLHEMLGFRRVAAYREVGRKFGRFWDVEVYERAVATCFDTRGMTPKPTASP
jgi:phosphinothricin acetyltransferase